MQQGKLAGTLVASNMLHSTADPLAVRNLLRLSPIPFGPCWLWIKCQSDDVDATWNLARRSRRLVQLARFARTFAFQSNTTGGQETTPAIAPGSQHRTTVPQ